ncbi:MAG: ATP-binding protein [bacterium]
MKSSFLDRILSRIDRIDPQNLQMHFLDLARDKGLMEAIFQAIQEGIVVINSTGLITYTNRAAEQLLNMPQDASAGRPIARYLPGIDWQRLLDLDAGEWSKIINYDIELTQPERRSLSMYVVPLDRDSPATPPGVPSDKGLLIMLRDITRNRKQEASAMESERLKAVKLLAAGVAHEIGNPLNSLNIHLQLIDRTLAGLKPDDQESISEALKIAKEEVSRLDVIITQFLRALRPSRPELSMCRIEDILESTLRLMEHDIRNRNISVVISSPDALPQLPLDPNQIKQAFFNVIKNATQAMPDGGTLHIETSRTDLYAKVAFRDAGTGIARKDFGHIFEPYHTTKADGTGLGLMIVQRIVQDHGGAIEVHSEPKVGTTVSIILPLVERQMRLLKSRSPSPEASE